MIIFFIEQIEIFGLQQSRSSIYFTKKKNPPLSEFGPTKIANFRPKIAIIRPNPSMIRHFANTADQHGRRLIVSNPFIHPQLRFLS
jgi:hypothetical protein